MQANVVPCAIPAWIEIHDENSKGVGQVLSLCLAKVLDSVSSASDLAKLETIYELTLDALKATANQRPLRFEREGQPPPGLNTELMVPDCDDQKKIDLSVHSFRPFFQT